MEWIRLFHRILTLILSPFALIGCVAMTTAPITLPIWLIWLLVAVGRPTARASWYSYSFVLAFLFLCAATTGLIGAMDPNQLASAADFGTTFFFVCLFFSAVMAVIWRGGPAASPHRFHVFMLVLGGLFILGGLAVALPQIVAK